VQRRARAAIKRNMQEVFCASTNDATRLVKFGYADPRILRYATCS
jgi:hypothetical protein